jgi:hypothetical protein
MVFEPLHPEFEPIVARDVHEVIAELVEVIR